MKTKHTELFKSGVHIDRYERDGQWTKPAIIICLAVAACALVYYVGVVVMG